MLNVTNPGTPNQTGRQLSSIYSVRNLAALIISIHILPNSQDANKGRCSLPYSTGERQCATPQPPKLKMSEVSDQ